MRRIELQMIGNTESPGDDRSLPALEKRPAAGATRRSFAPAKTARTRPGSMDSMQMRTAPLVRSGTRWSPMSEVRSVTDAAGLDNRTAGGRGVPLTPLILLAFQ
jgi:hypothetical protein